MPGARENAEVLLKEKVPVINVSLGKCGWIAERAHKYGGKVIATVVNEKHAMGAEQRAPTRCRSPATRRRRTADRSPPWSWYPRS